MTALRPSPRPLSHPPTRPWMAAAMSIIAALVLASAAPAHALKPFGASGSALQGRYRALVVWVQDYEHWTRLSAPKKDAERIARALTDKYLFAPEDVELLGNPTQAELFKAVKSIATKAKAEDSVLIVFAGHGFLDLLNPASLEAVTGCKLEPMLGTAPAGARFQFERLGYFAADPDGRPGAPVFNRTVSLKETWIKSRGN